ncbi:MAG: endonuclease III [Candidatus Porifericomitaceae bacterium WSBS_2022_MAG_OTU9]
MTPAASHDLFKRLHKLNPKPRTELRYRSNFQLLVAVVLSAQCTDTAVNKATPALFAAAPNPKAMLALGIEGIEEYIHSIGLYHSKAKNLHNCCALLLRDFKGKVPRQREQLQSLPGVGRKTANVVLNTAFGEETIAVDTHIFRVANRTGLAPGKTPLAVEQALMRKVPQQWQRNAHHWLILHGRYICRARKPSCPSCPLQDLCQWREKAHWLA